MSGEIKPNHLIIHEINYELRIRGIITERDVHEKRKILGKALRKDKNRDLVLIDPNFDFEVERNEIQSTLNSIKHLVEEFEGTTSDSVYIRVQSRLCHAAGRIKRIVVTEADGPEVLNFKNEAYATCLMLEADLDENVRVDREENAPTLNNSASAPATTIIRVPESKVVDIYKWDIKFDGSHSSLGVKDFLERINEIAAARHVAKAQLFESAVELFSGKALLWFRQIRDLESINDWDSLVVRLERDFLKKDYDEELWAYIKGRKQQDDETVVIFAAVMASLFKQLSSQPAEITKIKWIRKNLKSQYVNHLALSNHSTVEDLVRDAKILEEVLAEQNSNNFNANSRSQNSNINFGENSESNQNSRHFSYRHSNTPNRSNFYRNPSRNIEVNNINGNIHQNNNVRARVNNNSHFNRQRNKSDNQGTTRVNSVHLVEQNHNESGSTISCWNCGRTNHKFRQCRDKQKIFCFKCGKPGVTRTNCCKSSENK